MDTELNFDDTTEFTIGDEYASVTLKINNAKIADRQRFRNLLHASLTPQMHRLLNEIVTQQKEINARK